MRERLARMAHELHEFALGPDYVREADEALTPIERAAGLVVAALLPILFIIVGIFE